MTERPAGPSAPKVFLDQKVIPAAIDLAGEVEAGVERLAALVRREKCLALGGAAALALVLTRLALRRR